MSKKKVLFIHRSVGHYLVEQGRLRERLSSKDIALDDYDNNSGILTQSDGSTAGEAITMPGNNTNPDNLAEFFGGWPNILDDYDIIMIKSCYPNSHIKDAAQLATIKNSYNSIIKSFSEHNKPLFILTSPPLRPLFTNATEARLSGELADWLVSLANGKVRVFDFHHLLAEATGRNAGMLKRQYRRLLPFDNHPNQKAHQTIAPQLVENFTA
jgi:hypothetical protein